MSTYTDDAALAAELYEQETPGGEWRNTPTHVKREYLIRAMGINNDKRREAREREAAIALIAAVNAYRVSLPPEVSGRWVFTRQIGFQDGWEAALAWVAQQRINDSEK